MNIFYKTLIFSGLIVFLGGDIGGLDGPPPCPPHAGRLIEGAKQQIGITLTYNPAYQKLSYPMGDLPLKEGVCTDVVIRAFRSLGLDLQKLVHEDMKRHWHLYPKKWGNTKPDHNIDHRRVPNLIVYFQRQAMTVDDKTYLPGDLVVWDLGGGVLHIGLLSDKTNGKHPLVIHNICCGVKEEDILTKYKVVGHFRLSRSSTLRVN